MNNQNTFDFVELTELWQDGRYDLVVDYVRHSEQFSNRANLIDFCIYLHKYLGSNDLQILQKLI
jgi:hypothetical protein